MRGMAEPSRPTRCVRFLVHLMFLAILVGDALTMVLTTAIVLPLLGLCSARNRCILFPMTVLAAGLI